jgi:glucan biosynthesis protein C
MNETGPPLKERPPAQAPARLYFLDHLRAALVILVVLHHVAIVYGAAAPFYYTEPPIADAPAFLVLLVFALLNQAWFMGCLFLIAGYFTPGAFDRKGPRRFLRSRFTRLGIPLVAFFFLLNPLASVGYWQMPASLTGLTTPLTWAAYPYLLGMGPLWFVALLLLFDLGYAGWRALRGRREQAVMRETFPGYAAIGAFVLGLSLVTYLTRIVVPLGRDLWGFPTLAYLPQYLSFFVLGAVAYRRDWLGSLRTSMGTIGLISAMAAAVALFPVALSRHPFSLAIAQPPEFVGLGTWPSAVYAAWDSVFAVGMCLAALTFFRRKFDVETRLGTFLAQQSYAVYVTHAPVLVFVAVTLKSFHPGTMPKFALVSLLGVPLCFGVAYLIRRIPLVSRVL